MQSTSTLKPTAMLAASLSFSDSVAQDLQARDSSTDGDDFDEELEPRSFRGLGLGYRRILAGIKDGLGRAFSRHDDDGSVYELREALAEGRRQVAAERRASRRARREARAQLVWEEREIRAGRRLGLLAQQIDLDADSTGARPIDESDTTAFRRSLSPIEVN